MRALITGAGGFIGRSLCAHLRDAGADVVTLGHREGDSQHYRVDPAQLDSLIAALDAARPDVVFHLAGVMQAPELATYYRVNTLYAAGLLTALERTGQADVRVVLTGSAAEYGPVSPEALPIREEMRACPVTEYGISKLAQTRIGLDAAAKGQAITIARPSNVIGPGMPGHLAVEQFARQIVKIVRGAAEPILRVGNLESERDFIDVDDVARILVQLARHPDAIGRVVNVCRGTPTKMRAVVDDLIAMAGVDIAVAIDQALVRPADVSYGSTELLHRLVGASPLRSVRGSLQQIFSAYLRE
jgi:GDP-4-dehydro-6-deoxy-D-mannose reductase